MESESAPNNLGHKSLRKLNFKMNLWLTHKLTSCLFLVLECMLDLVPAKTPLKLLALPISSQKCFQEAQAPTQRLHSMRKLREWEELFRVTLNVSSHLLPWKSWRVMLVVPSVYLVKLWAVLLWIKLNLKSQSRKLQVSMRETIQNTKEQPSSNAITIASETIWWVNQPEEIQIPSRTSPLMC